MAEPHRHPAPDNLAQLIGSSASTGEPPTFEPIAAPATARPPTGFDPHAFVAEMRAAGVIVEAVYPVALGFGEPVAPARVIARDVSSKVSNWPVDIGESWEQAIASTPDWVQQVKRVLAEEGDPVFALIAAHEDAYAAWTAPMPADMPTSGAISDAETAALEAVIAAEPRTIPGLKAWIKHLHFVVSQDGDGLVVERAFPQLVAAADALLWSEPRRAAPEADAHLLTLGATLDRLEAEKAPLRVALNEAVDDDDQASAAYEIVDDQCIALYREIAAAPAVTLDGYAVKARALAHIYWDGFEPSELGLGTYASDSRLIWSILSGLAGATAGKPIARITEGPRHQPPFGKVA